MSPTTLSPFPRTARLKPPGEKIEQRTIIRILKLFGFDVGSTSQYRRSGQMLGLPDLVLFHKGLGRQGWFECKGYRPTATYSPVDRETWEPKPRSPEQEAFGELAQACGAIYGWGGHAEAEQLLITLGLALRSGNGSLQRVWPPPRGLLR